VYSNKYIGDTMIEMAVYLKNGQCLTYKEINKVFVEDGLMTISTFRGQYSCLNINEVVAFEMKYPQAKASKAYAMFKQLVTEFSKVAQ